jgi:hypothetical protein
MSILNAYVPGTPSVTSFSGALTKYDLFLQDVPIGHEHNVNHGYKHQK